MSGPEKLTLVRRPVTGDYSVYDCEETGDVWAAKGEGVMRRLSRTEDEPDIRTLEQRRRIIGSEEKWMRQGLLSGRGLMTTTPEGDAIADRLVTEGAAIKVSDGIYAPIPDHNREPYGIPGG